MSFLLYLLISPLPVLYHCVKVNLYSNVVVLWCVVVPVLAVAAPPHVHRGTDLFYRHSGHELQLCHTSRYSSLHLLTQCQYWCLSSSLITPLHYSIPVFSAPRESVECADTVLMSYWYFGEQWAEGYYLCDPYGWASASYSRFQERQFCHYLLTHVIPNPYAVISFPWIIK